MDKEVNIYFKVDGLDGYLQNLDDLKSALGQVEKATDEVNKATSDIESTIKSVEDASENLVDIEARMEMTEGAVKSLAGGLEILAGAAGLLGMDDVPFFKELEENTLQILSLSQGAIDLTEGLRSIKKATIAADGAQKAFNATALLNPYVALGVAVVGLGVGLYKFIKGTNEAREAQAQANLEFAAGEVAARQQRQSLDEQVISIIEAKRATDQLNKVQNEASTYTLDEIAEKQSIYTSAISDSNKELDDAYFHLLQTRNEVKAGKQPVDNLTNAIAAYKDAQDKNNETVAFYNTLLQVLNQELTNRKNNEDDVSDAIKQSAAYDDTIEQSISKQIDLYTLLNQREIDRYRDTLENRERDLYDAEQKYFEQLTIAGDNADLRAKVQEDYRLTVLAINQKYDAMEVDENEKLLNQVYLATLSDQERQEALLKQAATANIEILDKLLEDKVINEEQYAAQVFAINERLQEDLTNLAKEGNDERAEDAAASANEIAMASLEAANTLASALQNLSDVSTEERLKGVEKGSEEEEQILREQFERNKKFQIAQAVIATAQSVMQALSSSPPPVSFLLAAANAAAGALQIAAIKKTTFDGGDTTVPSAPNPAASINYSFGQQAGQTIGVGQSSTGQQLAPVQTYVLASDVTNAQQAQQQIQNLSRL